MIADYLEDLHPDDVILWLHVEKACWRLAHKARLTNTLNIVRPTPKLKICYDDGQTLFGRCWLPPDNQLEITLRLFRSPKLRFRLKGWSGVRIAEHCLIDTIAHEMAHLEVGHREKEEHGPKFFWAFSRMLKLQEDIKIRLDIRNAGVILPP